MIPHNVKFRKNSGTRSKTIFKQTLKFTKDVPEQRISPEGFLIRDCGCVMRFLPNLDNKSNKTNLQTTTIKNLNIKKSSHIHQPKNLNQIRSITADMNIKNMNSEKLVYKEPYSIKHDSLYQSTFWMEPRIIPVKYTTEVNFNPESTIKRFSEKIDLQMKLVPCPYIQQIGTTTRFKTSIETRIQTDYIVPLETAI